MKANFDIKAFFSHLKHIFKDSVENIEAANTRKKEIMPFFLTSLGIMVVPFILAAIFGALKLGINLTGVFTAISFVGLIGVCAFGFLLWTVSKIKSKYKNIFCDNCNTRIEYGDNVSYTVTQVYETKNQNSNTGDITVKEFTKVDINCVCQNCNAKKTFKHEFLTMKISGGQREDRDVDTLIKDYFGNVINDK